MKSRHIVFMAAVFSLASIQCKKSNGPSSSNPQTPSQFHEAITIHEIVKFNAEAAQKTLGLFQPASDPNGLIYVATRGRGEQYAVGFRVGAISKDSNVSWIKSFAMPEADYEFQFGTTAVIDHDDNILVGGNIFPSADFSFGSAFLTKLSKSGDILWSKQTPDSNRTSRGLVLKILRNGDIAYVTYFGGGFYLYRLDANGNTIWAKAINVGNGVYTSPYVSDYGYETTINQMLEETSDGSLFFGFASYQSQPSLDCLLKFSSSGDLLLSKSFTLPGGDAYQPALLVTENDDLIYFNQKGQSDKPYFLVCSKNLEPTMMKTCNMDVVPWNTIEQVAYNNGKIYLSMMGQYELYTYTLDGSLNQLSGVKTLASTDGHIEYGGVYSVDAARNAMYAVEDIPGEEGDGFQFLKTDGIGLSCHPYADPVLPIVLSAVTPSLSDLPVTVADVSFPFTKNVNWTASTVHVSSSETVCSKN